MYLCSLFGPLSGLNEFLEKKGCEDNFFKGYCIYFVTYRSLYSCFSRNSRDCKETNDNRKYKPILGYVLCLFEKSSIFVQVRGNIGYFLTSLLILIVEIAIIRLRKSWYVP